MNRATTLRWALAALAVSAIVAAGIFLGAPGAMLALATAALAGVIVLLWWSVQSLGGEGQMTLDDALTLAAPSAEEERKVSLLRALRDLEYERSVGKISEADFHELSARYRAEAKAVLRHLHDSRSESVAAADREIEARLAEAMAKADEKQADDKDDAERDDDDGSADAADAADEPADTGVCEKCSTKNEVDAVFCKRCGARLADRERSEASEASGGGGGTKPPPKEPA